MRARNYATALRLFRRADSLVPSHAGIIVQVARAEARTGDAAGALRTLARLRPLGHASDLGTDSAFVALWPQPAFARLRREISAAAEPLVRSETSFVIHERGLGFEGMAHGVGPDGRVTFYLGASRGGSARILRVDAATRAVSDLVRDVRGGFLGMRVDWAGRLWVANTHRPAPPSLGTSAAPAPAAPRPATRRSELQVYDTRTGTLLARYPVPDTTRDHLVNDLVAVPDGRVFVTDSDAHEIHVFEPGAHRLRVFVARSPGFLGPNGIDLAPDGRHLYVTHLEGISKVRLSDGQRTRLAHPPALATGFSDGLYTCGRGLIGIQGVADYHRVSFFRLDASAGAVVETEVLERRHPEYAAPSTGAIVGGALHYIAARRRSPDRRVPPDSSSALILRLPLGDRCGR